MWLLCQTLVPSLHRRLSTGRHFFGCLGAERRLQILLVSFSVVGLDQSKPAVNAATALAATPAGPVGQTAPAPGAPGTLTADAVRQGISFQPRIENGKVAGFAVSAGGDGGAFRAAGFQPGDVIVSVGGKAVSGETSQAELAAQIRPGQAVSIMVKRNGQQLPLALSLSQ